jgi:Flp pilus assembly protein TadB
VRNLTQPRCPECGNALRLSLAIVDPYIKAWLALMIGSCLGAGVGLICVFGILKNGIVGLPGAIAAMMFVLIAMIPIAISGMIFRRRFGRFSRKLQWVIAGICLALTSAAFAVMFHAMQ